MGWTVNLHELPHYEPDSLEIEKVSASASSVPSATQLSLPHGRFQLCAGLPQHIGSSKKRSDIMTPRSTAITWSCTGWSLASICWARPCEVFGCLGTRIKRAGDRKKIWRLPVQSPALRAWRSPPHRLVSGKHFLTPEAVPGAFVVPLRRGIEIARPRRQVLANHVFV